MAQESRAERQEAAPSVPLRLVQTASLLIGATYIHGGAPTLHTQTCADPRLVTVHP